MVEVGFWVSWRDIYEKTADKVFEKLAKYNVSRASIFVVAEGKVFFKPKDKYFTETKLKPVKGCKRDLLAECVEASREYGLKLTATMVCVVDPLHAEKNPECRLIDFRGSPHPRALCPNNPDVQKYLRGLAENIAYEYEVDEVELDYIRFKRSREGFLLPTHLLIGRHCYCSFCREKAVEKGLDWKSFEKIIEMFKTISETNHKNLKYLKMFLGSTGDLNRFYLEHPEVADWLRFRAESVKELIAFIKESVEKSGVALSADLFYPTLSWQVGQDYSLLREVLDTVKPMIYTARMGAWETKYIKSILDRVGWEYEDLLLETISHLLGVNKPSSVKDFEYYGLPPEIASREALKVAEYIDPSRIYVGLYSGYDPSIVYNPPRKLLDAIKEALKINPKGLYFFSFSNTPEENFEVISRL